jgi:predicted ester cyclase
MSETNSKNKALMSRVYEEMWNGHNPAIAMGLFAKPEGVEKFVHEFLSSFPDLQHVVDGVVAEGDIIVARFSAYGTHKGKWLDFEKSGKPIHYSGATWARIADGKIVEHHTWWDKAGLIEQIANR